MKLYNTLTRKKEEFKPLHGKEVGIYTCGPTVYDLSHVGHARTYISFDILVRYLKFLGYKVNYVVNVTDVDDKIINRAKKEKIDAKKFTDEMTKQFFTDFTNLGIQKPNLMPKVTENMPLIIKFIEKLVEKGFAYESDGDIYFAVRKFKDYGKLSGNNIEELESGARVEPGEKKNDPLDFALWKKAKEGETIAFKSPWGEGRPGWHIECSALSGKYVGDTLDIHGGGNDLVFPHHEDEIAQSEAANGKKFANFWIHTGLVTVNDKKMSKSLGNFITIRDILKKYEPAVLRMHVLESHYRSPIDFNENGLEASKNALQNLRNDIKSLKEFQNNDVDLSGWDKSSLAQVIRHTMDDDLNTPKALAAINIEVGKFNKYGLKQEDAESLFNTIMEFDREVLGLNLDKEEIIPENVQKLAKERERARKEKSWKESDKIRAKIDKLGYVVEDTENGPIIREK